VHVFLDGASIAGGTLKTASVGTIEVQSNTNSSTFDGSLPGAPLTNAGSVVVDDQAVLALLGTINNSGSITLKGEGNFTELQIGSGGRSAARRRQGHAPDPRRRHH
jgi:hypothetical protein